MVPFLLIIVLGILFLEPNWTRKLADATEPKPEDHLMQLYNVVGLERAALMYEVKWNFFTNVTERNKFISEKVSVAYGKYMKEFWINCTSFDWKNFQNQTLHRMFKLVSVLGWAALEDRDIQRMVKLSQDMMLLQGTDEIHTHEDTKCNLTCKNLENEYRTFPPDEALMYRSWLQSHNIGKKIRPLYKEFITYLNKAAILNKFKDNSEMVIHQYEIENFFKEVVSLWNQIQPFYVQLHAYIRRKLIQFYESDLITENGPIPAHLLGDETGWTWLGIENITKPFANIKSMDVTPEMIKKNLTVLSLYKMAEEFFLSLGFKPLTSKFWQKSLFEKPSNRTVICSGSSWDMLRKDDYRIKMCTQVSMSDFLKIHHEMGHVQYYIECTKQPFLYRNSPNPGFHKAIGDTIALSVVTPTHLYNLGLLPELKHNKEEEIAHLFFVALQHLPLMAYSLFFDSWQWKVFQGEIKDDEFNAKWWDLRLQYQGISPPRLRTEKDFDAGTIYHLASGSNVIVYFISRVLQFQFHRSLCKEAKEYIPGSDTKPLHKCNIFNSIKAGKLLREMLQMGRSKPWPDTLYVITKSRKLDVGALLEYFQPLIDFLTEENKKNKETIGWNGSSSDIARSSRSVHFTLFIFFQLFYLYNK